MRLGLGRHRLIRCLCGAPGFGGRLTKALDFGHRLAEIAQAPIAQRGLGRLGLLNVRPRPLGSFRLDLADGFLERQSLARDVGLVERGLHAAQLADQRGARPIIERAAVLARVLVEPADGAGN